MTKKDYLNGLVLTDSELNSKATLLIIYNESAEIYSDVVLQGAINDLGESASDESYIEHISTSLSANLGLD